jgi:histone-lysine N-methyltransferase SETMAR
MPKLHPPECDALVKAFSKDNLSHSVIADKLKLSGYSVSKTYIHNVLNGVGGRRQARLLGHHPPPNKSRRIFKSKDLVKKVSNLARKENPMTQSDMAKKFKVSPTTINRVIHKDLKYVTRKKTPVHQLKPRHIKNRKTNARKLYEKHLSGSKSDFIVTLDEAWFYLSNTDGKRKICYRKKGESIPASWVVERGESYQEKFMVVGAMCEKGVLPLIRVPPKVKVNSDYYISHVLKPLLECEVVKLYGNETNKVVVHHDLATSHSSKKTMAYAADLKERLGISIIPNSDIPVKSPDISPMDFFGFGYLKQKVFKRKAKTLEGLWKVVKNEWSKVTPETCRNVLKEWKRKCNLVRQTNGLQIEPLAKIHRRKITQ